MTFIDDSSQKVWFYYLKHKSDVFGAFKSWKPVVENDTDLKGKTLKTLQSDNGGEYVNVDF